MKHGSVIGTNGTRVACVVAVLLFSGAAVKADTPPNLLENPGGESGDLSGWTILHEGAGAWSVATQSFDGAFSFTAGNDDTNWPHREQVINLTNLGYSTTFLDGAPAVCAEEWAARYDFPGGTNCGPDNFRLLVSLEDATNGVIAQYDTGELAISNYDFVCFAYTFTNYGAGLRYIRFEDYAESDEDWFSTNEPPYGPRLDGALLMLDGPTNDPPYLTMPGSPLSYTENDAALLLDEWGTVRDVDSSNLAGGTLTAAVVTNGTSDDRLEIRNQGTGSGEVGISGSNVTYGGTVVGTWQWEQGATGTLVVTFNTNADAAAVEAVLRNLTYHTVADDPATNRRTVQVELTDGDGGVGAARSRAVDVVPVNDPPLISITGADYCVEFSGTGDCVSLPPVTFGSNFTLEAWVYIPDVHRAWQRVFDFGTDTTSWDNVLFTFWGTEGRLGLTIYNQGAGDSIVADDVLPSNQWIHVAAVIRSSQPSRLLVNGNIVQEKMLAYTAREVARTNSFIGRSNWPADEYLRGAVDRARIWTIARSQDDIRNCMYQPVSGGSSGLLACYRFDAGSGTNVFDSSTNGLTGTNLGGAWYRVIFVTGEYCRLSNITVTDPDAGTNAITLQVTARHGTLHVADDVPGGLTAAGISGNGSSSIIMSGTTARINTTLASESGLVYQVAFDTTGDDLTFVADDHGHSGGAALVTTNRMYIRRRLSFDLSITKEINGSATRGEYVEYTLVISNTGPETAAGAMVREKLSRGCGFDSAVVAPVGCTAWYRLEESPATNGTLVHDYSGNGNDGVLHADDAGDKGVGTHLGRTFQFDGNADYVLVTNITWAPSRFSVSFWLYPRNVYNWNQQIQAGAGWGAFVFHATSANGIYVGTDVGTRITPSDLPSPAIETYKWQHFCFTYDGGTGKLYRNGILLATKTGMTPPVSWDGFIIGATNGNTILGRVDEVMLLDYAASSQTVAEVLYGGGISPPNSILNSHCLGWYHLEESPATNKAQVESVGHGPVAELYVSGTGSVSTAGFFGRGFEFIHPGDYVEDHQISGQPLDFTVSFWLYPYALSNYNQMIRAAPGWGAFLFHATADGAAHAGVTEEKRIDTAAGVIELRKWQHFCVTYDRPYVLRLYKNGVLLAERTDQTIPPYNWVSFQIGHTNEDTINGRVDEVIVLDYAASSQEVAEVLYGGGVGSEAVRIPVGDIPSGESARVVVRMRVCASADAVTNTATASAFAADLEPSNDTAAVESGLPWDAEGDGMYDVWERIYGYDPTSAADGSLDDDGDGFLNWQECVADTGPYNSTSLFQILDVDRSNSCSVSFACTNSRVYDLEYSAGLSTESWSGVAGQTNVRGAASGTMTLTDTNTASGTRIYRVRVSVDVP